MAPKPYNCLRYQRIEGDIKSVYLPLKAYSQKYGYSQSQIYEHIRTGKVEGFRFSRRWFLQDRPPKQF
jgi:predicted DNA-binding transcriptional regulator AlpA